MPERLETEVLHKVRYINTLAFTYLPIYPNVEDLQVCFATHCGWHICQGRAELLDGIRCIKTI